MEPVLNGDALTLVQIDESYFSGLRKNGRGCLLLGDLLQNEESRSRKTNKTMLRTCSPLTVIIIVIKFCVPGLLDSMSSLTECAFISCMITLYIHLHS